MSAFAYGFREPFMLLVRWFVCSWKGHRERRVPPEQQPLDDGFRYNRICTRCGRVRLAKTRKKETA